MVGDEAAGADHVNRRAGIGHHAAFLHVEAGGGDDLHRLIPGFIQRLTHPPDRRRRHPGADQRAQFHIRAIATDRPRRVAFQHGIALCRVQPFEEPSAMGVQPHREAACCGDLRKAGADFQRVGDFAAEIIDQHRQRRFRECLVKHLGRAQGGACVADQGVRHCAVAV